MMKKRILALLLGAVMVTSMAACGSSNNESSTSDDTAAAEETQTEEAGEATGTETKADSDINITMILKATTAEYWQYMIAGAKACWWY